jgi:hypothetical protein
VALTDPIGVVNSGETFNVLWSNVPQTSFSTSAHPCIRIYVLPENLGANFGSVPAADFIRTIHTQPELDQVEARYGVWAGADFRSAQMNFTNLKSGNCPASSSCRQTARRSDVPEAEAGSMRIVKASFNPFKDDTNSTAEPLASLTGVPSAQGKPGGGRDGLIRIFVDGFGMSTAPGKSYTYITALGGVGFVVTNNDLQARQQLTLEFEVTNPRLLRRDLVTNPPTEIVSPARTVFLGVRIFTTNGLPAPSYTVNIGHNSLGPGETTRGTVVVTPAGVPPQGTFKRWGLSLHAGANFPHGSFSVFGSGFSLTADLEYRINQNFSFEGLYGFNRFKPGLNLHNLSANGKFYFGSASTRPFFNFGGGVYVFGSGTVHAGANLGAGLQFNVNPNFAVEAAYNFHEVFTSGSHPRFSTLQGGVRFRF